MRFSEEMLDALRKRVSEEMSDFRFVHTAEVEKMAMRLGALYAPDKLDILRAAALLHDITKECATDGHIAMLAGAGESVGESERLSYKTLHARSAVVRIKEKYPEFADGELLGAVRYHTTGRADMTVCERVIYLADYIDESRKFEDCVRLRSYFWDAHPEDMNEDERKAHLDRALLLSFDMTLGALIDGGEPISEDTVSARNSIILEFKK